MNMYYKIVLNTTLILLSAATISSCSHEPKDTKEVAEEMNDNKFNRDDAKDAECVVNAYSSNLFEIKVSENAAMNASSAEVKELASMLTEKHTKMNEEVRQLADKKQISLPTDLTNEQRKKIENLTEKNGVDYDKEYVKMMKEKHIRAVKAYEKDANDCVDNDIKLWASQTIPEIRAHLDRIETTWNSIKDLK